MTKYDKTDSNKGSEVRVSPLRKTCWLARVLLDGVVHRFLVDTGSSASILSKDIYDQLDCKPGLVHSDVSLTTADGGTLNTSGQAYFEFCVDKMLFSHEFSVAELDDLSGILGSGFLEQNDMTFRVSKGFLHVAGHTIELEREGTPVCTRVKLCKNIIVPPDTEVIVQGYAVGNKDNFVNNLLEPFQFVDKKGLLVVRTLVNPEKILFSVVNIADKPVKLEKNMSVASLQPINIKEQNTGCSQLSSQFPEHLRSLYDKSTENLTELEKSQVSKLLTEFQNIFVGLDGKFGRTPLAKHSIDTGNSKPIIISPRRVPYAQRPIVEQEIKNMLQNDYRKLNTVTKKNAHPLPKIDEALDALTGASWFSTLDLISGYWQCEMSEKDKHKTAFSTHMGLYQFKVLPFGISNVLVVTKD